MLKIEDLYGSVFQPILGETVTTKPGPDDDVIIYRPGELTPIGASSHSPFFLWAGIPWPRSFCKCETSQIFTV